MDTFTPPPWTMRAWRIVGVAFACVPSIGALGALATGELGGATALGVSALIFWLNVHSYWTLSVRLERRSRRLRQARLAMEHRKTSRA